MSMISITANSIVSRRISSYNFKRILLTYVPMILLDVLTGARSSAGLYTPASTRSIILTNSGEMYHQQFIQSVIYIQCYRIRQYKGGQYDRRHARHFEYRFDVDSIAQHSIVQHSIPQYRIVQNSIAQHSIALHSMVQYSIVQYSIVQYSIVQYSIAQHSIAQHSIAQSGIEWHSMKHKS